MNEERHERNARRAKNAYQLVVLVAAIIGATFYYTKEPTHRLMAGLLGLCMIPLALSEIAGYYLPRAKPLTHFFRRTNQRVISATSIIRSPEFEQHLRELNETDFRCDAVESFPYRHQTALNLSLEKIKDTPEHAELSREADDFKCLYTQQIMDNPVYIAGSDPKHCFEQVFIQLDIDKAKRERKIFIHPITRKEYHPDEIKLIPSPEKSVEKIREFLEKVEQASAPVRAYQ